MDMAETFKSMVGMVTMAIVCGVAVGAVAGYIAGRAAEIIAEHRRMEEYYRMTDDDNRRAADEYARAEQGQGPQPGDPTIAGAARGLRGDGEDS